MFDIGFWELILIVVIGLVVIGPERLPGFMRVTDLWLGKARRTIANTKREIKDELYEEDLRRTLAKNSPAAEIRSLIDGASESFDETVNIQAVRGPKPLVEAKSNHKTAKPD